MKTLLSEEKELLLSKAYGLPKVTQASSLVLSETYKEVSLGTPAPRMTGFGLGSPAGTGEETLC